MSLAFADAVDLILARFKTAWDATGYDVFYEDVAGDRADNEDPWAQTTLRHRDGFQATLASPTGRSTYRRVGDLTVQIFTSSGSGLSAAYSLAKIVADAFEGNSDTGGLWYRDVTLREAGRDGAFFQINVIVGFEYDEVK